MCEDHLLHLSFAFWQHGCHHNYYNNRSCSSWINNNNSRRWNNDNNSGRNNDNNGGSTDPGGWDLLLPGSNQCGKHWEQTGCGEGEDGQKALTTEERATPAVYGTLESEFQLSGNVKRD